MEFAQMATKSESNLIAFSKSERAVALDRFQVFGERRSGTNFVENIMKRNTDLRFVTFYGWKHGIPYYPVFPACCLFFIVVRHPLEWVRSFYRGPYEGVEQIIKLPFSEFIRSEWEGHYRPDPSPWNEQGYTVDGRVGWDEPLQLDRHPIEGRRFHNVMEMRNIKLAGQLSLLKRGLNAVLIRYEDMLEHREAIVQKISDIFSVRLRPEFDPVEHTVGPRSFNDDKMSADDEINLPDRKFILSQLDSDVEAWCGYKI